MRASPVWHFNNVSENNAGKNMADKRVYQIWQGSNRFLCGGRLVFGPDFRTLVVTIFLIVAPIVVFCLFVGRHLIYEFPQHMGIAIVVVAVVYTFIVLLLLLMTSSKDPGIIPRNAHPPESEGEVNSSSEWSGGQTPKPQQSRTKDVVVNGVTIKIKYCETCMLYRPPRCSHCSICNNCVEQFDHHCPWVGQCIGRRNYLFFLMFVSSTTLLCFYIFAMCVLHFKKLLDEDPARTVLKALQRSQPSVVLILYTFLATWFVGGLTIFHLYLISTNQTTYENFRRHYDNKANPYNQGALNNFKTVLCSGIAPSKNNFRAKVQQAAPAFTAPTLQLGRSVNTPSPARKACADEELDNRAVYPFVSVVGTRVFDDTHSPGMAEATVSKQSGEDLSTEPIGKSAADPNETVCVTAYAAGTHDMQWGSRSGRRGGSSEAVCDMTQRNETGGQLVNVRIL